MGICCVVVQLDERLTVSELAVHQVHFIQSIKSPYTAVRVVERVFTYTVGKAMLHGIGIKH